MTEEAEILEEIQEEILPGYFLRKTKYRRNGVEFWTMNYEDAYRIQNLHEEIKTPEQWMELLGDYLNIKLTEEHSKKFKMLKMIHLDSLQPGVGLEINGKRYFYTIELALDTKEKYGKKE